RPRHRLAILSPAPGRGGWLSPDGSRRCHPRCDRLGSMLGTRTLRSAWLVAAAAAGLFGAHLACHPVGTCESPCLASEGVTATGGQSAGGQSAGGQSAGGQSVGANGGAGGMLAQGGAGGGFNGV